PRLRAATAPEAPLSKAQEGFLGLAMAVDAEMSKGRGRATLAAAAMPRTKSAASAYAKRVQARVAAERARRRTPAKSGS
ncbi:MAG: hypothetical protein ACRET8_01770, partial [Burkholderiales bacterium]